MRNNPEKVKKGLQKRLYLILFLLTSSVLALLCARLSVAFSGGLDAYIGAPLRSAISRVYGSAPFSVTEALVIASPFIIALIFVYAFRAAASFGRAVRFLLSLILALCAACSVYLFSFGIAYSKAPFYEGDYEPADINEAELYEAAMLLSQELSELSPLLDGAHPPSVSELEAELGEAASSMVAGYDGRVRLKLFSTSLFPSLGIRGLYFPLTAEVSLCADMPLYNIPFTAAHELSHYLGVAREGEASFFAFLLCRSSQDPYIRYSGALSAYEYLAADLYRASPELYFKVLDTLPRRARLDMAADREYRKKYEDNSAAVSFFDGVRDAHLAFSGSGGEMSYSYVTGLIVACLGKR